jgi:hypothetical protein
MLKEASSGRISINRYQELVSRALLIQYKAMYFLIDYILSFLLYSRKIAQETGSRLIVSWNK